MPLLAVRQGRKGHYHMHETIATALIFFGAFLAWLLSAGQLALHHKKIRNYLLCALLFSIGGWQLHTALFFTVSAVDQAPYAYYNLPLLFLTGPLLYYYFREVFGYRTHIDRTALLHLLPATAAMLYLLPFYAGDLSCKHSLLHGLQYTCGNLNSAKVSLLIAGALGSIEIYLAIIFFVSLRAIHAKPKTARISEWLALLFIAGNIANTAICFYGVLTSSTAMVKGSAITVTFSLCFVFLLGLRYEKFLNVTRIEAEKNKYEISRLGQIDLNEALGRLDTLMRDKKLYRNENLTLMQMADEMRMTTQQLSEVINKGLNKNFFQFVNKYRIAEACQMLVSDADKNILEIAFAVGFNSKSVFNRVFTQIEGNTPSEYRRSRSPQG